MANKFLQDDEQDESQLKKNRLGGLSAFMLLINYARDLKSKFVLAFLLLASASAMAVFSGRLLGQFVQNVLLPLTKGGQTHLDYNQALPFIGAIMFFEITSLMIQWLSRRWLADLASKVIYTIRAELFEHLQLLPMTFYDRQPQGRIITRITHDVEGVESFFTSGFGMLLNAFLSALMAIIFMLSTDWQIGLPLVVAMLPAVIFLYATSEQVRQLGRKISRLSGYLNAKLSEFVSAMGVIRSCALEDWSKEEYDGLVNKHLHAVLDSNFFYSWSRPLVSLLCSLPLITLLALGGYKVLAGSLMLGSFVAFLRYYDRFFGPIMVLARELHTVQEAFTSAERVSAFLRNAREDALLGKNGALRLENIQGEIAFKDVWMSYNANYDDHKEDLIWALKEMNFDIKKGEKVGLVGRTGHGKTSTVALLTRLYPYQKGEISIDGHSLKTFDRHWLRSQVGMVAQDVVIFRASLRENLSAGKKIEDELLLRCAEDVGLLQVMNEHNLTLDSEIYEGGANLSVGQRQLIALARILILGPSILILDEATANIDPYYESLIHKAIVKVMQGRTCLFIAHRLATLSSCDRILVFHQGQLVEEGHHQELMEKRNFYFNLQMAQKHHTASEVADSADSKEGPSLI